MSWNYRILKHKNSRTNESYYAIHEVHYNKDGVPRTWSKSRNLFEQEELDDLVWVHEKIKDALEKPVLEWNGKQLLEIDEKIKG